MELRTILRGLWDRIAGWALIGVGVIALLLGWNGVADTALTSEQMPYVVSGGLVGLALIGIGATLLISSDLRDEWRKLDRIEEAIRAHRLDEVVSDDEPPARPARSRPASTKRQPMDATS